MELAEWLLARIAEDEATARSAQFNNGKWHRTGEFARPTSVVREFGPDVVPERPGSLAWDDNGHIARWDPARVLAECEAKRRIIRQHGSETEDVGWTETRTICATCRYDNGLDAYDYPCPTLIALAAVYADHPDFRDEWRP
jgi:hypothetical protein